MVETVKGQGWRGGAPTKRRRTEVELDAAAERFRADWVAGDWVMTWLRRHEGQRRELSDLVRSGWSWDDLGKAMARAGITYSSGQPIAGSLLTRKAREARRLEDSRTVTRDPDTREQDAAPPRSSVTTAVVHGPGKPAESPEQEFPLATLRRASAPPVRTGQPPQWEASDSAHPSANLPLRRPRPSTRDPDEIIARFLGKTLKS